MQQNAEELNKLATVEDKTAINEGESSVDRGGEKLKVLEEQVEDLNKTLEGAKEMVQDQSELADELVEIESEFEEKKNELAQARAELKAIQAEGDVVSAGEESEVMKKESSPVPEKKEELSENNFLEQEAEFQRSIIESPSKSDPSTQEIFQIMERTNLTLSVFKENQRLSQASTDKHNNIPGEEVEERLEVLMESNILRSKSVESFEVYLQSEHKALSELEPLQPEGEEGLAYREDVKSTLEREIKSHALYLEHLRQVLKTNLELVPIHEKSLQIKRLKQDLESDSTGNEKAEIETKLNAAYEEKEKLLSKRGESWHEAESLGQLYKERASFEASQKMQKEQVERKQKLLGYVDQAQGLFKTFTKNESKVDSKEKDLLKALIKEVQTDVLLQDIDRETLGRLLERMTQAFEGDLEGSRASHLDDSFTALKITLED